MRLVGQLHECDDLTDQDLHKHILRTEVFPLRKRPFAPRYKVNVRSLSALSEILETTRHLYGTVTIYYQIAFQILSTSCGL